MKNFTIAVLILGGVAFVIWGFQLVECPKCEGKGEFSRKVQYKEDCQTCKGRGEVHCSYNEVGDGWQRICKSGTVHYYVKEVEWLFNPNPGFYLSNTWTCNQCKGTSKHNCRSCSGFGYHKRSRTEYEDDVYCNGSGEITNFKSIFD